MRVATYFQSGAVSRGSVIAIALLVLTILLGTSAIHTLLLYLAPQLSVAITIMWLVTYLLAFTGLMFSHGINWISWMSRYRILLLVLLLGTIVSVSWAMDAAISAERTVHLIGSSIIAVYLGFMIPLLSTLRVFGVVLATLMFASIAVALGLPELGIEAYDGTVVWRGILNSKNALGFWAAVGVLLYITLSDSVDSLFMRLVCYAMALTCLAVLYFSHSATSLLALLVAGALSLYIFIAMRFQLGFIRMAVMAILFGALTVIAISNIDTFELVGRTDDLTGRGEVWRQTWKLIMQRPLTGYGYGSLWFPNDATLWIQQSLTDFTWVVYHAHNGFLQVASEIGLPLSFIALLMVAQQLIEIFYCQYERQQVGVLFVLAFVVAYLIGNFSEARFLVNRELYWIFFLALPISMLRQINLLSSNPLDAEEVPVESEAAGGGEITPWVPGKPWLHRPIATTPQVALDHSSGHSTGTAVVASWQDGSAFDMDFTAADVEDDLMSGLQDATDIDLGQAWPEKLHISAVDRGLDTTKTVAADVELDATADLTQDEAADAYSDVTLHLDEEEDRYNKLFGETGEWIDIPLGDKQGEQ